MISGLSYTLSGASILALLLINVNTYLIASVEAGFLNCFKTTTSGQRSLDRVDSPIRPRPPSDNEWSEAFRLIDKHLRGKISDDDLDANLREVKTLLGFERGKVPLDSEPNAKKRGKGNGAISQKLSNKREDIATAVLQRLYNIINVKVPGFECMPATTMDLKDINDMALDTIGRRNGNRPDMFGRVDSLIFKAALQRAETCLLRYKSQILRVSFLEDRAQRSMMRFLDGLFERKMREVHFGGGQDLDVIFERRTKEALEFVRRMPISIDSDLRVNNFRETVGKPCRVFVNTLWGIIDSMDFDLQLRRFISLPIMDTFDGYNHVINKQRAYFVACSKFMYI